MNDTVGSDIVVRGVFAFHPPPFFLILQCDGITFAAIIRELQTVDLDIAFGFPSQAAGRPLRIQCFLYDISKSRLCRASMIELTSCLCFVSFVM
jgi:hypothetical protein